MTTLLLSIGIFVGLLFYELTGLAPGGIIVPGYIALYITQPLRILSTILTSLIALALGRLLLRFIIAYGRRRFGLFLLLGIAVKILLDHLFFGVGGVTLGIQSIGIIIPGIIANEMERQGVWLTLLSLAIVSAFLYIIFLFLPQGIGL
jgi:poly-gamma-glutamate biosynthesis protein PgsC/CapC